MGRPLMRVALLIDYPLLLRAVRAVDAENVPNLTAVVQRASALGSLLTARGYGAWYDLDEARGAFTAGVDPVFVPPAGAGSVPTTTALVTDGFALLRSGQVDGFVLSGDDRLLPLAAAVHAADLPLGLVAHSCLPGGPSVRLAQFAEPAAGYGRTLSRAEKYRRPLAPAARSA